MPELQTRPPQSTASDVADLVHELTSSHVHREHFQMQRGSTWYGVNHTVRAPSLLAQLAHASPSSSGDERGNRGTYTSRPAARLEALDCLTRIDREAASWVRHLGEDDPGDTAEVVLMLHGLMRDVDEQTRRAIARDVRRWWAQARTTSGWDSAPWRPNNTCPLCGQRGGLRIKLANQLAFCVECGETWADSIGLLADHIRAENAEQVTAPGDLAPSLSPVAAE